MEVMGTLQHPYTAKDPMRLAEEMVRGVFRVGEGNPGLWFHADVFWMWYGGRWEARSVREMENEVLLRLMGAHVKGEDGGIRRMEVTPLLAANVVRCLEAVCLCGRKVIPAWVGRTVSPIQDESKVIAFRDVLAEVREDGTVVTHDRDERWLDPMCLEVDWREGADITGTRWAGVLETWSGGDPAWVRLLQRWGGYQLLPWRGANRWLLKHGKIQAGKTTWDLVMLRLMGPKAFVSTSMYELAGPFGASGLQHARALSINDAEDLDREKAQRFSAMMKVAMGGDYTTINEKGRPLLRNVRVGLAVSMNANLIPKMANEGQGVSGKMLVLPYEHSLLGRADPHLMRSLEGELGVIARWMVQGAQEVVRMLTAGQDPWQECVPATAEEHVWSFRLRNNPWDAFLEARFVRQEGAFVPSWLIWREWLDFARENRVQMHVARNLLTAELVGKSTWDLRRHRQGSGGDRGLLGLALRRVAEDEGRRVEHPPVATVVSEVEEEAAEGDE